MKVYELQFRAGDNFDEDSFVLWIKTDGELTGHSAVVCNEIDIGQGMPGLDAVVEVESHEHIIITRKEGQPDG